MSLHRFCATEEHSGQRLDVFLTSVLTELPSRGHVQRLIEDGAVGVNDARVKPNYRLKPGDDINVDIPEGFATPQYAHPENIPLDIFYEDESLYIINKPSGMVVHPAAGCYSGTLVNALLYHAKNLSDFNTHLRPGIVHRLDAETSGLMVVAKDNITHTKLAKQFKRHMVKKQYVALVAGEVQFDEGKIDAPIGRNEERRERKAVSHEEGSRDSVTFYKVRARKNGVSLVSLFPKTGRMHQLRVHMEYIGHPILGDAKYGRRQSFPRLALHAQGLGFFHPRTKKFMEFLTPPPPEFLTKIA